MDNNVFNPYQATAVSLESSAAAMSETLASPVRRLGASFIDSFCIIAIALPIAYFVFQYNLMAEHIDWQLELIFSALMFITYLVLNIYWLGKHGQTIGKKICSIRVVRNDGTRATLFNLIIVRYLPWAFLTAIEILSWIPFIDVLFIFGKKRQCIHDMIADTKVINV